MREPFHGLTPTPLWSHFSDLVEIARPSKREQPAIEHLAKWAQRHALPSRGDEAGNLCVYVPAKPGRETAPLVVLQSHVDIVASNAANRPEDADAALGKIPVIRASCPAEDQWQPDDAGDWLVAPHTTLGADNGIGVAAAMAVAEEPNARHGPLALFFTVDEEQGLTGAQNFEPTLLQDARFLINLDNEDDDSFTVGCAGGLDLELSFDGAREPLEAGQVGRFLRVDGLRGGHSGVDIHRGRANAIRLLARLLDRMCQRVELRLVGIEGGDLRNAIPRTAMAHLFVSEDQEPRLRKVVDELSSDFADQYQGRDEAINVTLENGAAASPQDAFTGEASRRLIDLLHSLPTGIIGMCPEIPKLVETSDNLAVVKTDGPQVKIVCSCRSSSPAALSELCARFKSLARLADAQLCETGGYPGWKPDFTSTLLQTCRQVYRTLFPESEPRIEAIHAGLECGAILARCSGLEAISLGPTLRGNHAPGERISITSVAKFYRLLLGILDQLSQ
jgi:dipeptidase D